MHKSAPDSVSISGVSSRCCPDQSTCVGWGREEQRQRRERKGKDGKLYSEIQAVREYGQRKEEGMERKGENRRQWKK